MSGDAGLLNELSRQTLSVIQSAILTPGDVMYLSGLISQIVHLVNSNTSTETLTVRLTTKYFFYY